MVFHSLLYPLSKKKITFYFDNGYNVVDLFEIQQMKKTIILSLMLLITATSFSQCLSVINGSKSFPFPPDRYNTYGYVDGSLDVNNALDIFPTQTEPQGFDYDLEMGYRKGYWSVYAFYGEYRKVDYVNFGLGVDYFFLESRTFDIATGVNFGAVESKDGVNHFAYAARIKPILDINDVIAIYGRFQYQQRPDRFTRYNKTHGVFEFNVGVQLKIY